MPTSITLFQSQKPTQFIFSTDTIVLTLQIVALLAMLAAVAGQAHTSVGICARAAILAWFTTFGYWSFTPSTGPMVWAKAFQRRPHLAGQFE